MKTKKVFFTELAYVAGLLVLAFGTALMERADFGMSMVVALAYLLHLKVSQYLPWFSFGMSEYVFQALLLIALALVMGKFRLGFLFSFVTAVLYGLALDGFMALVGLIPDGGMAARVVFFLSGMLLCALGVALFFHTYISPEAYELVVKEVAAKWRWDVSQVKTVYDCVSCLVSILMSFLFFGLWQFEGIKLGTVICALVNGWLIGQASKGLEKVFQFRDGLKLRPLFEN